MTGGQQPELRHMPISVLIGCDNDTPIRTAMVSIPVGASIAEAYEQTAQALEAIAHELRANGMIASVFPPDRELP